MSDFDDQVCTETPAFTPELPYTPSDGGCGEVPYTYDTSGGAECVDPSQPMSHWAEDETCVSPAPTSKPGEDVVYLGLNDPVRDREAAALPEGATAVVGSKKPGTVMSEDGKREIDLKTPAGVSDFLKDSGVGAPRTKDDGTVETPEEAQARVAALEDVFLGKAGKNGVRTGAMANDVRDEMANFVRTMQKVENGDLKMERLIISGHHYPDEQGIHGPQGRNAGMTFDQLNGIMSQFGHAQAGVKDLMFSACNTVNNRQAQDDTYRKIFPNLESTWGYSGYAPSAGLDKNNSSMAHIQEWEKASRGDDPQAVVDAAKGKVNANAHKY